jgi:hypothetical protein
MINDIDLAEAHIVIELDWKAYFEEFQRQHGGEPVLHQPTNRLLFRDGWMYSASDYKGPEWEAPADTSKLRGLQLDYWTTRRAIVFNMLESLKGKIGDLQQMQRERSAPLQRVLYTKSEDGKTLKQSVKIDIPMLLTRVSILEVAMQECQDALKALNEVCNDDVEHADQ